MRTRYSLAALLLSIVLPALGERISDHVSAPKHSAKATNILWRDPGQIEALDFVNFSLRPTCLTKCLDSIFNGIFFTRVCLDTIPYQGRFYWGGVEGCHTPPNPMSCRQKAQRKELSANRVRYKKQDIVFKN